MVLEVFNQEKLVNVNVIDMQQTIKFEMEQRYDTNRKLIEVSR